MARPVRSSALAAAVAVTAALAALPAVAQTAPEDDSALRQNCVGDYFRFCATYLPGSTEIRRCFAANTDRLTPECRGAIRAFDRRNGTR